MRFAHRIFRKHETRLSTQPACRPCGSTSLSALPQCRSAVLAVGVEMRTVGDKSEKAVTTLGVKASAPPLWPITGSMWPVAVALWGEKPCSPLRAAQSLWSPVLTHIHRVDSLCLHFGWRFRYEHARQSFARNGGLHQDESCQRLYGNATEVIRDAIRRMQAEESRVAVWQAAIKVSDDQLTGVSELPTRPKS